MIAFFSKPNVHFLHNSTKRNYHQEHKRNLGSLQELWQFGGLHALFGDQKMNFLTYSLLVTQLIRYPQTSSKIPKLTRWKKEVMTWRWPEPTIFYSRGNQRYPLGHLHNSGPHEKVNVTFEGQRIDVAGLDWNIASTLPNKEIHVLLS